MSEQKKKHQSSAQKRRIPFYPKPKNRSAVVSYAAICDISLNRAIEILVSEGLKTLSPDLLQRMQQEKQKR